MLTTWMMYGIEAGFLLDYMEEPFADAEVVKKCAHLAHTISVPDNLILRFKKSP